MTDQDLTHQLVEQVTQASKRNQHLQITAGGSKQFYPYQLSDGLDTQPLDVSQHVGIIDYEPSELYITARCGTALRQIEDTLAEHNQMLAFEPPAFSDQATIGGTVACGLSGPRRPYAGACRDAILGVNIINGLGEYLSFGGQVMKNVAGYDVSRAMCGALGTLGVIAQITLKVIPIPKQETTICLDCDMSGALKQLINLTQTSTPISASYYEADQLFLRLALTDKELEAWLLKHSAKMIEQEDFWKQIKEQQCDFFNTQQPLWRCSLPMASPALDIDGDIACEWNGGLHWYKSHDDNKKIIAAAEKVGGTARLFRYPCSDTQSSMSPALMSLHQKIKQAFDPKGLLNPGQLDPAL